MGEQDIMLLFLGAGASKPFGIPDMNELTNIVINELKNKHKPIWIIEEFKKRVENFGMKPDIEAILTCIDALKNPEVGMKNAGAFAAYLSRFSKPKEMHLGKDKEFYENLSRDIREVIRNRCFLPEDENKINNIVKVYDNLFSSLNFNFFHELSVFTTNYDYCFETYCFERECDFFDGFEPQMGIQTYVGMDKSDKKLKICKLHGSSNYVITTRNKLIKTDQIVKPGDRVISGKIAKESMIYPTTEKYFSKDPYFSSLRKLREDLVTGVSKKEEKIILIVGYSFRDDAINNAFIDALNTPIFRKKHIFLIDPFANSIINNIPEFKKIIEPINKRFENISKDDFSKAL